MGDPVGHVPQEELLSVSHPHIAHHEDVGVLFFGDTNQAQRGVVRSDHPCLTARSCELAGDQSEVLLNDWYRFRLRPPLLESALRRLRDHLDEEQLRVEAVSQIGRPLHCGI
jgi:hypothetical protein